MRRKWGVDRLLQQSGGSAGQCIAASQDWFWTGSYDSTVKMWDANSGQLKASLGGGHGSSVQGLAVSPTSPHHLFSGAVLDPHVNCWDVEYGRVIHSFNYDAGVGCLALEPTLNILVAAGDRSGDCRVWDPRIHGAHILTLSGHTSSVRCVVTQPTQPHVLTGSLDTTIKLWDLASHDTPSTLSSHRRRVCDLAIPPSRQGRVVASASRGGIKTFTLPQGHPCQSYSILKSSSTRLAINQEDVMVSASVFDTLRFWDFKTGRNIQHVQPLIYGNESFPGIEALSFDSTGTRLLTCERSGAITLWKEQDD